MIALILVLNAVTHDSRVLREAETLATCGYDVDILGLHETGLPVEEHAQRYRVRRVKLVTRPLPKHKVVQVFKYVECLLRMTWRGVRLRPNVIHANDIACLPIGLIIAKLSGAKLIYDAHEYWPDVSESRYPQLVSRTTKIIESRLARKADVVMTVCDSIAEQMARTSKTHTVQVIRNVPALQPARSSQGSSPSPLHDRLSIARKAPIILHLGMVAPGRGVETLLKAMQDVSASAVAILLGSDDVTCRVPGKSTYAQSLHAYVEQLGLAKRVYFVAPVIPTDVYRYAVGATIGVAPIEPVCLNNRYSLPNKLFQYIQAGLPVVASDLPEMAKVVRQYEIGEVFPAGDSDRLAAAINSLLTDPVRLRLCQQNSAKAAQELNWNKEQAKLIAIYEQLKGMNSPVPQLHA